MEGMREPISLSLRRSFFFAFYSANGSRNVTTLFPNASVL